MHPIRRNVDQVNKRDKSREKGRKLGPMAGNKLFRPKVADGLCAVVNLGVLGIVGYQVYKRSTLVTEPRVNARPLAIISGGLIGLFILEGWATEAHLDTPQVRP